MIYKMLKIAELNLSKIKNFQRRPNKIFKEPSRTKLKKLGGQSHFKTDQKKNWKIIKIYSRREGYNLQKTLATKLWDLTKNEQSHSTISITVKIEIHISTVLSRRYCMICAKFTPHNNHRKILRKTNCGVDRSYNSYLRIPNALLRQFKLRMLC